MGKSAKKNNKVKRTVRRTIGALCMLSAITIAAIPTPENRAYNPADYDTETEIKAATDYPSSVTKLTFSNNEDYHNDADCDKAYYAYQGSDGIWILDWQFKYKNTGANGYLAKYNSQYQRDNIDIPFNVYTDFYYIPAAQEQEFFNDGESGTPVTEKVSIDVYAGGTHKSTRTVYSLNYKHNMAGDPDDTGSDAYLNRDFFTQEFPTEFSEYKTRYSEWKNDPADPKTHPKPEEKEYRLADKFSGNYDGQVQYLCDALFNSGLNMKLASAKMRNYNSDDTFKDETVVFIPMLTSQPSTNPLTTALGTYYTAPTEDNSGNKLWCLSDKTSSIAYIGQRAFEDVGNVDTLTIADEISVIGDYAFANSFIKSITLSKGCTIGNNCFEGCQSLTKVVIPQGIKKIGAEAFAGSGIPSVTFPITVDEIGMGAFKDCGSLTSISFDDTFSGERKIDDFAFYNCTKLQNVNIENSNVTSIGKCAFAIETKKEEVNKLENFIFPKAINSPSNIGDFVLYNRKGLNYVKLPTDLGASQLGSTMFYNCVNLGCVEFPDSLGSTSYESDDTPSASGAMFYTITNPDFYVRGPKLNTSGKESEPRKSTWSAISAASPDPDNVGKYIGRNVPYVYTDSDDKEYYEVSDGSYVMSISPDGILNNVSFVPGTDKDIDLVIPAKVGEKTIAGMTNDCFSPSVLSHLLSLTIVDGNGIDSIGSETFKDCPKLKTVSLGNSITTIGNDAFKGCNKLEKVNIGKNISNIGNGAFENCSKLSQVKFDSPDSYDTLNNIGTNAFKTGNTDGLTFIADINESYKPFQWAMGENNYVDDSGLRVCYKTPEPSCLTVILDNKNYYPTLVDYPHYGSELDDICKNYYYEYGLRKFANEPDCETQATALANSHDNLCSRYESGATLDTIEYSLIYATEDLIVPSGVKSIDAQGYLKGDSISLDGTGSKYPNTTSIAKYFTDPKFTEYKANGLFAGYYGDNINPADSKKYDFYDSGSSEYGKDVITQSTLETDPKGNDRLKYVELNSVKYLPDECFDNCEQLNQIILGSELKDSGKLPFHDCTNLGPSSLGNDTVFFANGILYQREKDVNGNDILKIVECLPSRGTVWGVSTINSSNDPELINVNEINERAFADCPNITSVDLSNSKFVDSIPDECFKGSSLLTDIDLPECDTFDIGNEAFADTGSYTKVIVRGKQSSLGTNAFKNVAQPKLVSYDKSAVINSAKKQGVQTEILGYIVKFMTQDGLTKIESENVIPGNDAKGPNSNLIPAIDGYIFKGWDRDITNVNSHIDTKAVYESVSGVTPGVTPGTTPGVTPGTTPASGTTPGVTNKVTPTPSPTGDAKKYTLTVVYGSGSGQYAANTKVIIEAIGAPEGKEFDKWVVSGGGTIYSSTSKATTITTAASDATVTATYKDSTGKANNSSGTYSRSGSGSASGSGTSGNGGASGSGTSLNITKPGISDVDKGYASVSGSTDNFVVKVTEDANAANIIATALANRYPDMTYIKYFPMDISLYDATGNSKIPNGSNLSVNVTMPIPDALREYGGNCKVASVVDGMLEDIPCKFVTVSGVPCVSFTATHFSPYVIYVDTNNLVYGAIDGSPKTGDPIHPKWFVVIALAATSLFLFLKKDKVRIPRTV